MQLLSKVIISHYLINYISLNNNIIFIDNRSMNLYETSNLILGQHQILIEWKRDDGGILFY